MLVHLLPRREEAQKSLPGTQLLLDSLVTLVFSPGGVFCDGSRKRSKRESYIFSHPACGPFGDLGSPKGRWSNHREEPEPQNHRVKQPPCHSGWSGTGLLGDSDVTLHFDEPPWTWPSCLHPADADHFLGGSKTLQPAPCRSRWATSRACLLGIGLPSLPSGTFCMAISSWKVGLPDESPCPTLYPSLPCVLAHHVKVLQLQ